MEANVLAQARGICLDTFWLEDSYSYHSATVSVSYVEVEKSSKPFLFVTPDVDYMFSTLTTP